MGHSPPGQIASAAYGHCYWAPAPAAWRACCRRAVQQLINITSLQSTQQQTCRMLLQRSTAGTNRHRIITQTLPHSMWAVSKTWELVAISDCAYYSRLSFLSAHLYDRTLILAGVVDKCSTLGWDQQVSMQIAQLDNAVRCRMNYVWTAAFLHWDLTTLLTSAVWRYGNSVDNTDEENSSVFSLIRMHQHLQGQ